MSAKPKVYVETTIPSYLASRPSRDIITAGHQSLTHEWWATRKTSYELYISELVFAEIANGDMAVAAKRKEYVAEIPSLASTNKAEELAQHYLATLLLPAKAYIDALHLAIASCYSMEYLLTWNCRHLAHGAVMHKLPSINAGFGLSAPTICTPQELLYED